MDPLVARRTVLGAPVVHGIHLVAWALEQLFEQVPLATVGSLRGVFRKPLYLGREVDLAIEIDPDRIRLHATAAGDSCLELDVRPGDTVAREVTILDRAWPEPVSPSLLSRDDAARAEGHVEIAIDSSRARTMFPAACARLGLAALAELLATTRIVGMHCPGYHSLYSAFKLEPNDAPSNDVAYEVREARLNYSMITVGVRGPRWQGTLDTFYRPVPATPIDVAEACRMVAPPELADRRALVVGGSRGLGEAFAKLLAVGGAEVCLTYHRGAGDAERVVAEIRAAGFDAAAMPFDVLEPEMRWPFQRPPTHLYYLATPVLYAARKGATVRADEIELMVRYFVTGLHATVTAVLALAPSHLVVWTPSTTMLDTLEGPGYCIAKAAMEELCKHLPRMLPVTVHAPRIGRVHTDQTIGLIQLRSAAPLDVALEALRATTLSR